MEAIRWQRLEEIYHAALEKPFAARRKFLDEVCGDDEDLRDEVVAMISAYSRSGEFLNDPVTSFVWQAFSDKENVFFNQQLSPLVGKHLGHFQILQVLGFGGMGEVFLAKDTRLGRTVALKLLPEKVSNDIMRVRRFKKEAQTASLISHPNVAQVYEIGEADESLFIALEYVEGKTLREYISNSPMDWCMALQIAKQITSALKTAHEKGIAHRDIKPENVMIDGDNVVKVLDFGLAKLNKEISVLQKTGTSPAAKNTNILSTEPGDLLGTVDYMSPEQARGVETNSQTDVWSLGVVLYEMLTGKPPFKGDTPMDTLIKIVSEPFVPNEKNEIPKALLPVIERCLCKKESGRYKDGGQLLSDLNNINEEVSALAITKKPSFKNTLLFLLVSVVVLTGLSFSIYRWRASTKTDVKTEQVASKKQTPITTENFIERGGISWWHGDGNALDSFGNNNGEMLNGATFDKGLFGQAFSFDGNDDYFQSSAVNLPTGNSPRTIELWFKANSLDEQLESFLVGYGDFTNKYGKISAVGVAGKFPYFSSWGPSMIYQSPVETNRWYHLAVTVDGQSPIKLFVDGKEKFALTIFVDTAPNSFFIMGKIPNVWGNTRKFNGMIDEIRVFNRALSPEEIAADAGVVQPKQD